jgi:SNF2 family DNA or RNA helicase
MLQAKFSPAPSPQMLQYLFKKAEKRCRATNCPNITKDIDLIKTMSTSGKKEDEDALIKYQQLAENLGSDPESLQNVESRDEESKKKWFRLNNMTNQATAKLPDLDTALKIFGMTPETMFLERPNNSNPRERIAVSAHQLTGALAALCFLASPLHFGVIADDVGLGKTRLALIACVQFASFLPKYPDAQQITPEIMKENKFYRISREEYRPLEEYTWPLSSRHILTVDDFRNRFQGPHRPTLILFPSSASSTWKNEIVSFERAGLITVYYWLSDNGRAGKANGTRWIDASPEALKNFIDGFDTGDPATARIVILSSLNCFGQRTVRFKTGGPKKKNTEPRDRHEDDDDEDNDDHLDESLIARSYSLLQGYFQLIILDESHRWKNPSTRCHLSVVKAQPRYILSLTATPV